MGAGRSGIAFLSGGREHPRVDFLYAGAGRYGQETKDRAGVCYILRFYKADSRNITFASSKS